MSKKKKGKLGPNDPCPICGTKIKKHENMKECKGHKDRFTPKKIGVAVLSLTVIIGIVYFFQLLSVSTSEKAKVVNAKVEFELPNRQLILQKLAGRSFSEVYTPVHIFRDNNFCGSGSLREYPRGSRIATVAHLFPEEEGTGYYSFQKLVPFEEKKYPISHLEPLRGNAHFKGFDVIFCVPGPQKLIEGLAGYHAGSSKSRLVHGDIFPLSRFEDAESIRSLVFVSLVSGKRYPCLGGYDDKTSIELKRLIIPRDTIAGESGSGYVTDSGELLVLTSFGKVTPEIRRALQVPPHVHELSAGTLLR